VLKGKPSKKDTPLCMVCDKALVAFAEAGGIEWQRREGEIPRWACTNRGNRGG
jgi:hypothetical protein